MDGFDKDVTGETTQPVKDDDLWVFVTMALATLVLAVAMLLGLCVHA